MSFRPRSRPFRVLMAASEMAPFAKAGGLADVVESLSPALHEMGIEARAVLPLYGSIDRARFGLAPDPEVPRLVVPLGGEPVEARFYRAKDGTGNLPVHFVACERFFDRPGIYNDPASGEGYSDNAARFVFFCRAATELMRALGWRPDVIHCHDHQTAPIAADLHRRLARDPFFSGVGSVLTIHNLGYQGSYPPEILSLLEVPRDEFFPMSPFEFFGNVNLMKIGIQFADLLTTVSSRYAQEITESAEFGAGLEGVLRSRGRDLVGILNGVDYTQWDPTVDKLLPARYGPDTLDGKETNREALRSRLGLAEEDDRTPIVGMISRLVDQKGFDLLEQSIDAVLDLDVQFAILGTGQERYHRMLQDAAARHPGRVGLEIKFDNNLAHLIEAGSDMFLMPSRYEPCGLNQMYSLRYGTVPVVRATGGLADTVRDDDERAGEGTGFVFTPYEAGAMLDAVRRARQAYADAARWRALMVRGMRQDFSWKRSARQFIEVYEQAAERASRRAAA